MGREDDAGWAFEQQFFGRGCTFPESCAVLQAGVASSSSQISEDEVSQVHFFEGSFVRCSGWRCEIHLVERELWHATVWLLEKRLFEGGTPSATFSERGGTPVRVVW